MNENEFRSHLRDALGEPPRLAPPRLWRREEAAGRVYPAAMVLTAGALTVLIVVVLVASRVALHPQGMTVPGAKPSAVEPASDSYPCSLAVVEITGAANPGQNPVIRKSIGFLNIPSGEFRVDPAANVTGLPGSAGNGPTYSASLKRWIPAILSTISPDGRTYAYVRNLPEGETTFSAFTSSELHVYDVEKKVDRSLWSRSENVRVIRWEPSGILVSSVAFKGGTGTFWRIDPATGSAVQSLQNEEPMLLPCTVLGYRGAFGSLGSDSQGRDVFWLGTRDPGAKYSIVAIAAGKATTLYQGTAGDPTDFDPQGFVFDAHGLWMGNSDGSRVWLWAQASGLLDFKITNVPAPPAGYQYTNTSFIPAGPCMPGVFAGVAPTRLPAATTPSPSPTPPVIEWSKLTSKPLKLDQLAAGAQCPVSSKADLLSRAKTASGRTTDMVLDPVS